jgi:glycine amidinotransferase
MKSRNEWGKLKKVIVGVSDYATIPKMDRSLRLINYADKIDVSKIPFGSYPQKVIEEANEDLEIFVKFLKSQNVEVLRPKKEKTTFYNYCPRDCVFVHGNLELATPMPLKSRKDNWKSYSHHLENPISIGCTYEDELYNEKCLKNPDVLSLTENSPAFDAANILRSNNDLLYLVSNSGNIKGAELLQSMVDPGVKVHLLQGVYSYMHIDSTISFLREGLLLANPSRIKNKDDLPYPFCNWDIIWCPDPIDMGYFGDHNYASFWVWNMNLLSINANLVVLEEHQHPTRKLLEKYGIECAMLPMRHARTLSGSFHCVTLDLERE